MAETDTSLIAAYKILREFVPEEDLKKEGVADTPGRMVKALGEMLSGYAEDPVEILSTTFPKEGYDQIVVVKDIPFSSLCEHHVLPFIGEVSVAYLPGDRIVGLSKIPRLVHALSRRLQVQERLTQTIADTLIEVLGAQGVGVVVEAHHSCMSLRGVRSSGRMVTSAMLGEFRGSPEVRAEVLALMGRS